MRFQSDKFSGEIIEKDELRWAVLDDGRRIPATIMLDYFKGVVPEAAVHGNLLESVNMHKVEETYLRRIVNRNGYSLDFINNKKAEIEDEIYKNLLNYAGLDYKDGLKLRTYLGDNLTYFRAVNLTKTAKKVTFKYDDGSYDAIWVSGECWIYKNGNIDTNCELSLMDFIHKVFVMRDYHKNYKMHVAF
jgi:hypothetical protein